VIKKDAALAAVDEQHEVALKKLDIYKTKIANTGNKLRNLRASAAVVNLAPGSATSGELWFVDCWASLVLIFKRSSQTRKALSISGSKQRSALCNCTSTYSNPSLCPSFVSRSAFPQSVEITSCAHCYHIS